MTDVQTKPQTEVRPDRSHLPLSHPMLPRWAPLLVAAVAAAASGIVTMTLGWGLVGWVLFGVVLYAIALPLWSLAIEKKRAAKDRLVTTLVWIAFGAALVPLASLIWKVVSEGLPVIDGEFLTYSMRNIVGEGGGIYHAIMGTLLVTAGAAIISIPVGVLSAIYLVEYGGKNRLGRAVTFLVDVMTGIPSIVAGLFAYALFVLMFGPGVRVGIGGSVALSLLMIPVVVRSVEEMLKLVPHELREASYALGVPKWRTVAKVVLPTAVGGIASGVTLAIARVIGETAPLLIVLGTTTAVNTDPFSNSRMATLPVFAYYSYSVPGVPREPYLDRAWTAALTLILIVMVLNLAGRLIARFFAPKSR